MSLPLLQLIHGILQKDQLIMMAIPSRMRTTLGEPQSLLEKVLPQREGEFVTQTILGVPQRHLARKEVILKKKDPSKKTSWDSSPKSRGWEPEKVSSQRSSPSSSASPSTGSSNGWGDENCDQSQVSSPSFLLKGVFLFYLLNSLLSVRHLKAGLVVLQHKLQQTLHLVQVIL